MGKVLFCIPCATKVLLSRSFKYLIRSSVYPPCICCGHPIHKDRKGSKLIQRKHRGKKMSKNFMNLHESALHIFACPKSCQLKAMTLANNGNGVQASPGMLGLALQASNDFDLKQSVQCNVMAKHGQICLTSTALQNVSSQEIVHTAGIREKQ